MNPEEVMLFMHPSVLLVLGIFASSCVFMTCFRYETRAL